MSEGHKTWSFDGSADRHDGLVSMGTGYYARYDEVLDFVVLSATISHGMRVLEIGTGTGNLALRCLASGASIVGLDPSERMLANAREKAIGKPGVEYRQVGQPFLRIPYADRSFDAVVSTYAFHHVPHGLKADGVREMVRVLSSGGSWAVGDLAFENAAEEAQALRDFGWLECEYFTRMEDLRPALADSGMELK